MRVCKKTGSLGFVLYAVLVVILLSSMVAVSLLYAMKSAETASSAGQEGEQAWAVALSGVYKAIQVALAAETGLAEWKDNPDEFKDQFVVEDGQDKWYFTVYDWSGSGDSESAIAYGITDEARKLNLKYLPDALEESSENSELFAALKERTSSIEDNDFGVSLPEEGGSEIIPTPGESQEGASPSQPKESEAEVPAPKGSSTVPTYEFLDAFVAREGYNLKALYGKDLDMNLKSDSGTQDVGDIFLEGVGPGALGMGLRHFLTTASYDLNRDSLGEPRLNINSTNAELATLGLSAETLSFIEAMQRNNKRIESLAVLLNSSERLKDEEGDERDYRVELSDDEMERVFDSCTTIDEAYLPALINVNTASKEVLLILPRMEESDAEAIISAREGLLADQLKTPAWLLNQGVLSPDKFRAIYPYITTRSWQYHFYVMGYSVPSGRYRVLEVIVDTAGETPRILMMRDLTRLGMPFKIDNGVNGGSGISSAAI